jgi:hypothetical protein
MPAGSAPRPGQHKKKRSPALFIVPIVLLVAAAVLFAVMRGGGSGGAIPFLGGGAEPVPAFDFKVTKAAVVTTSENTDPSSLQASAEKVSKAVVPVMDQLYTDAFLDPNNWKDGSYDSAWEVFEGGAVDSAQQQAATLTLGENAGDVFSSVQPDKGKVKVRVLFNAEGKPASAVAVVQFSALGANKDGTYTEIVSKGQYFLRDTGDGWKVYSFSVRRADQEARAPKPAPSASPSA